MIERPIKLGLIAGEESGDCLGVDLVRALERQSGRKVALTGVGGNSLEALGLVSLFPAHDIAIMGISAVVRDLPRLLLRIRQVARAVVAEKPDCLITIDSPDFNLRVARKVRAADPSIPVVHCVCPSVWAWRPGRAVAMRPYIDHILCQLPFEPEQLHLLGGPPGSFVGHKLTSDRNILKVAQAQLMRDGSTAGEKKKLLLLPGSRRGELRRLLGPFGETVAELKARGLSFEILLPTLPHLAPLVEKASTGWAIRPEIILDSARKWEAFAQADCALACSGTVALELALARVPFISCYKTDPIVRFLLSMITVWSAALPNLIADWPVVPEHINEFIRPGYLARQIQQLWSDTLVRRAQLGGFAEVAERLALSRPSGDIAAEIILRYIARKHLSA